jgi:hypothetical protein
LQDAAVGKTSLDSYSKALSQASAFKRWQSSDPHLDPSSGYKNNFSPAELLLVIIFLAIKMSPFRQGLLCGLGFFFLVQHASSQKWDGPSPYADGFAPDVKLADDWNTTFPDFEGIERSYPALIGGTDGDNAIEDAARLVPRAAKDFYLRILPLGASIVQGLESSDDNGFRKLLRQQLRWKGWKVNMVGSKTNGDMNDNVRRLPLSSLVQY